jgi:RNA polymerase sigma-70 factor (ECF subfamily)
MTQPEPPRPTHRFERPWIDQARAGDRSAQGELLRLHYARVYGTAFRLLGNPEDAEDLAQDCFVRAFRSLALYRGAGSFAAWLRQILVHLVQDRFRAKGKRPEPEPLSAELAGGRDPGRALEDHELARLLSQALEALPTPLRTALLLRTREGLEYEEVASLTGVTAETVRTRVMKARRALLRGLSTYLGSQRLLGLVRRPS